MPSLDLPMGRWRRFGPPAVLGLLLFGLGGPALRDYNVTWDEALGDLFFGDRYLSFFLSWDSRYLDFERNPYPPDRVPDLSTSPFRSKPWEYYPVANLMAAATSRILSGTLGVLDPFDGFHALNLLLGAALLFPLFAWTRRFFGEAEAFLACGLLFLSPRVFCHLMANIKDFPQMVGFTATLLLLHLAYEAGSSRGVIASGLVWGLALGTKANALFVAPVVGLFLVLVWWRGADDPWAGRRRRLLAALVGMGVTATTVVLVLWPYLWPDPGARLLRHLRYISGQILQVRAESIASPLEALLLTTPPITLLLSFLGLAVAVRWSWQGRRSASLLVSWVAVVLGRLYLPSAVNFDGVRHFLELFPALSILAAVGAGQLGRWAQEGLAGRWRPAVNALLMLLVLVGPLWSVIRTHPHQIAYWNVFTGGLPGARAKEKPQAGDYWGMSYRQGLGWLNENAPPGAVLAVPIVQHAVALVAPQRLRSDIGLVAISQPHRPEIPSERLDRLRQLAGEVPVYVMFIWRMDWANELVWECLETQTPAATWSLDGVPLLLIYRYRSGTGDE